MSKVALLIGVSKYEAGLNPLPNSLNDIEAMQRVLQQADAGGFDSVKIITNPDPLLMQQEIETLFLERSKDDLVLLFFSGHGIKDDLGRLYFATRITRKTPKGELIRSTAVPASFVHEIMENSRCKRQIVILDCCFSGAFATDMTAKDDGSVSVQAQLGGEGRAVLTSSTSTQYSFEQKGTDLSVYTQYLVEGLETGAADLDNDGAIAVDELHDYAKQHVREVAPMMKPEIYAVREGFRIRVAKAKTRDPKQRYRKEVEQVANGGKIFPMDRRLLNDLQLELGLTSAEASAIEVEVLQAQWDYQENLEQYEQLFAEASRKENFLSQQTQRKLKLCQERWNLKLEDVQWIETKVLQLQQHSELFTVNSALRHMQTEVSSNRQSNKALNLISPEPPESQSPPLVHATVFPPVPPPPSNRASPKPFAVRRSWLVLLAILLMTGIGAASWSVTTWILETYYPNASSCSIPQPNRNAPDQLKYSVAIFYQPDQHQLAKQLEQAYLAAGFKIEKIEESTFSELPFDERFSSGTTTLRYKGRGEVVLDVALCVLDTYVPRTAQDLKRQRDITQGDIQIRLF